MRYLRHQISVQLKVNKSFFNHTVLPTLIFLDEKIMNNKIPPFYFT